MPTTNQLPPTDDAAWDEKLLANPHEVADKRTRVQKMFAAIAPSYDLNNRLHSLWMDQRWRRKAVRLSDLKPDDRVVDVLEAGAVQAHVVGCPAGAEGVAASGQFPDEHKIVEALRSL